MSAQVESVLVLDKWSTFASAYDEKQVNTARIKKVRYDVGFYHMYGVSNYMYFYCMKPITVTTLQIARDKKLKRWSTWMVDDPPHYYAMLDYATRAREGKVLVGGLGLGLVVHHLLARKDISEIKVVEINRDVIDLISPYIQDDRVEIIHGDFYEVIGQLRAQGYEPSTIICDLWAGSYKRCQPEYEYCRFIVEKLYPYPKVLSIYHGFQKLVDLSRAAYAYRDELLKTYMTSAMR